MNIPKTWTYHGKEMGYRGDLKRTAIEVAEKSGFEFIEVYSFLFQVIKENHWSVKIIRGKIEATPGKIYIDWKNQMFRMPERATYGIAQRGNDEGADYWEGRILARQEACYD